MQRLPACMPSSMLRGQWCPADCRTLREPHLAPSELKAGARPAWASLVRALSPMQSGLLTNAPEDSTAGSAAGSLTTTNVLPRTEYLQAPGRTCYAAMRSFCVCSPTRGTLLRSMLRDLRQDSPVDAAVLVCPLCPNEVRFWPQGGKAEQVADEGEARRARYLLETHQVLCRGTERLCWGFQPLWSFVEIPKNNPPMA